MGVWGGDSKTKSPAVKQKKEVCTKRPKVFVSGRCRMRNRANHGSTRGIITGCQNEMRVDNASISENWGEGEGGGGLSTAFQLIQ